MTSSPSQTPAKRVSVIDSPEAIDKLLERFVRASFPCMVHNEAGEWLFPSRFRDRGVVSDDPSIYFEWPSAFHETLEVKVGAPLRIDVVDENQFLTFLAACRARSAVRRHFALVEPVAVKERLGVRSAYRVDVSVVNPVKIIWPRQRPWQGFEPPDNDPAVGDIAMDISITGMSFNANLPLDAFQQQAIVEGVTLELPPDQERVSVGFQALNARKNPGGRFRQRIGVRFAPLDKDSERTINRYISFQQRQEIRRLRK